MDLPNMIPMVSDISADLPCVIRIRKNRLMRRKETGERGWITYPTQAPVFLSIGLTSCSFRSTSTCLIYRLSPGGRPIKSVGFGEASVWGPGDVFPPDNPGLPRTESRPVHRGRTIDASLPVVHQRPIDYVSCVLVGPTGRKQGSSPMVRPRDNGLTGQAMTPDRRRSFPYLNHQHDDTAD
ncbi:hypothetical protein BO82DRAFT_357188, partial [Aspergillus uvarum CBS 121591]